MTVTRLIRIAIIGVVAMVLIAIGAVLYTRPPPEPGGETVAGVPAVPADATPDAVPELKSAAPEPPARTPDPIPPSFDAVRVDEGGSAVIAGSAAPNAEVVILDGGKEIGRAKADDRGDFVFIPDRPLAPGSRQLGLEVETEDGETVPSEKVVVLVVPEPREDIAGRASGGAEAREQPLALLVPRDHSGATQVLQAPAAMPTEPAGPPAKAPGPVEEIAEAVQPPDRPSPTPVGQVAEATAPSSAAASEPKPEARDETDAPVSIDIVDYDEAGEMVVSGRAAPETEVRLYLDNDLVGTARADETGGFTMRPDQPVDVGTYDLRVDQVDDGGRVMARAETPFRRADPATLSPGPGQVVVQPGNSLWRIARRVYGEGPRYTVIYQANQDQIRDPDLIYPGQIFSLPELEKAAGPG